MLLFLLINIKKHTFSQKYLLLFLYLKKFSYLCIVETNKQSINPLNLTDMKTTNAVLNPSNLYDMSELFTKTSSQELNGLIDTYERNIAVVRELANAKQEATRYGVASDELSLVYKSYLLKTTRAEVKACELVKRLTGRDVFPAEMSMAIAVYCDWKQDQVDH